MINLPRWELTLCPPLYDTASRSPIEQTAQVYAKCRELVEAYNQLAQELSTAINQHIVNSNEDLTEFEQNITCLMQNYIESIDTKFNELSEEIKSQINTYVDEAVAKGIIAYNEASEEIIVGGATE